MKLNHLSRSLKLALCGALVSVPTINVAQAQQAEDESIEKIAVVGTRAAPRSVADSPVPVDVIGGDEMVNQGNTDMTSMLQTVIPSYNVNEQPINDASTLVRPANLRGMASDHTLILVNGKRRHRSAIITFLGGGLSDGAQGPDVSIIPAIGLKQVEVLRDGAAAQYGSDAIGGVINFVLKDDSEGGVLEARYGSFREGDGDALTVAGNLGLPLADVGFANFSMEYNVADPTSRSVQRDDAQALIDAGNTHVANPAQVWGNPEIHNDVKFFANFGVDLGNDAEAYMFANLAEREVEGGFYFRNPHTRGGVFDGGNGNLLVGDLDGVGQGIECPVVPVGDNVLDSAAYQLIADNTTALGYNCFAFNEMLPGGFTPKFGGIMKDASVAFGTKGELDDDITYDVSAYLGQNEVDFFINNTINPSMGWNSPTSFKPGKYIQSEQSLNFDLAKAYDNMNLAGGVEYRHESYESIAGDPASWEIGPLASQGFGIGSNGFPGLSPKSAGKSSRHSVGAYVDVEYNVSDEWLVAGAFRWEDFSDFGSSGLKGKIATHFQLTDDIALRGAVATGFKAPTIGQSNVRNVTTAFGTDGRLIDRATLPPTDPISVQKGGTVLTPEESTSFSFGLVGETVDGLFFTVDFFNIKLKDRISTVSGIALTDDDIAALLAQGVSDASSFSEVSYFTNDFDTTTKGIDAVVSYETDEFGGDTKFSFVYNWTDTTVDDHSPNISDDRVRMLEDNLPDHRFNITATHGFDNMRFMARLNYFGGIFEDHLDSGLPIEDINSEWTVDFEVGYDITENFGFSLGAKNAFDETPDENTMWDTEIAGAQYPVTSPIGINGAFYYLKARYQF